MVPRSRVELNELLPTTGAALMGGAWVTSAQAEMAAAPSMVVAESAILRKLKDSDIPGNFLVEVWVVDKLINYEID